jgi:hypothetical protein
MHGPLASTLSDSVSGWSKMFHYILFSIILCVIMLATGIGSIASWFWSDEGD